MRRVAVLVVVLAAVLAPPAPAQGTPPGRARRGATLVLTHATVLDMTGAPPRRGMTLVLRDGRIAALHPDGAMPLPDSAEVRDVTGSFVLPGLVDAHVHVATSPSTSDARARVERRLRAALLGGVVAVRDMGGDARALADLARASDAGDIAAPAIHYSAIIAGPSFFTDPRVLAASAGRAPGTAPWARAVTDTTDLLQVAAEARGAGATAVKLYAALDGPTAAAVAATARRQGLRVWGHLTLLPARPSEVVAAGVEVVSHVLLMPWEVAPSLPGWGQRAQVDLGVAPDDPGIRRLIALMRQRGTMLEPTLFVYRAPRGAADTSVAARREALALALTRAAHQAGVPIVAGTDGIGGEDPGDVPNIHVELALLVRAGLTPLEALRAATRTAAEAAGFDDHGTIAVGKAADLLVLEADPTADIANSRRIAFVVRRGAVVPR